eukprot:7251375-Pyramimonas_sp.AAC.1
MTSTLVDSSDALVNLEMLSKLEVVMTQYSVAADFSLDDEATDKLDGAYARLLDKRTAAEASRSSSAIMASVT